MANILQQLTRYYRRANSTFEQASVIIVLICIGALAIIKINQDNRSEQQTDNTAISFSCPLTKPEDILQLDVSPLRTQKDIALVNFDTEVFDSGMNKNEIPAIFTPRFTDIASVSPCLGDDDELLLLAEDGQYRAYPKRTLKLHVAVNDTFNTKPLLITYSALSDHFQVYERQVKNEPLMFGISGLLYKNSELLYDTKSETLWSQLNGKALVGSLIGADLKEVEFQVLNFATLKQEYPQAEILSFETGYLRDYDQDPFEQYARNDRQVVGKITYYSDSYSYKLPVVGFIYNNKPYTIIKAEIIAGNKYELDLADTTINVEYAGNNIVITDTDEQSIPYSQMYWFVWYDLHPTTTVLELL